MSTESPAVVTVHGAELQIAGRLLRTARLRSEYYVSLEDPSALVQAAARARIRADILTFIQSVEDRVPRYPFYHEPQALAVLPISTYKHWFENQLFFKPRNKLRKALKSGIEIRLEGFSERLAQGIKAVYDETPIRQGKRNYHYHKNLDVVSKEHSTFLDRSQFITVYYADELIGFAKVTFLERHAIFMNIVSKISHRDKAVGNALVSKAVEICAERQVTSLTYGVWGSGGTPGLVDFKLANGFECVEVPRYYVPLSVLGKLALGTGLHRGIAHAMPTWAIERAAALRKRWNTLRYGGRQG